MGGRSGRTPAGHGWITPFTAMFLHGGVMHIISNMVFLAAFAPMVEDAMGRGRFVMFYLLGGFAATAAQIGMDPASTVPQLGASGTIAAVMDAFLVTYPGDRGIFSSRASIGELAAKFRTARK